ncbi:alpha-glucosidase [Histoplasma capsulatum var. duboisii H88]|uniref:Probable alpha/beta-glucosidase agdC n=1 Tax=Ajellomyces capsulatus (strain H88) TaxID=544711 RepID=F0UFH1_AJEC8|nr:alpha-glucosidase [Histoplasma capsulatum var. duboisii H88]QSS54914.1 alpha-glucosidase [Histoplasma capsulatum var. duboisii H88]
MKPAFLLLPSLVGATCRPPQYPLPIDKCPGYKASNVHELENILIADLQLAGQPCNTYGQDLKNLRLRVEYETDSRLHVKIYDPDEDIYQVPESVFPRPHPERGDHKSLLKFSYVEAPFSFSVSRRGNGEVLFDTAGTNLVFQSQYLNFRTSLPTNPNLYGMGEHTNPFRLNTTNYTATLWNRDAYGIPPGTNLYGDHPVYIDHRGESGTHGVFLLNSNGMDVKINRTEKDGQYLEYNSLGGIIDLYFFAGPTPKEVASQYAQVVGLPTMMPYWGFGFHQCRYGYRDIFDVAEVVYNYSQANIPLETMWTDIDYMDRRKVFTLDPKRFPIKKVRELVDYLHERDQHYIVMVDPAVAYSDNGAFNRGAEQGIFLKKADGSIYKGVVWPGVTAFPDWFHPNTENYWVNEFAQFFDAQTGVDIDGLWIDMNEPANFCTYPCEDSEKFAIDNKFPPELPAMRPNPRPIPGLPSTFQPLHSGAKRAGEHGHKMGLLNRKLIDPPYKINNQAGSISNKTADTDLVHANGWVEYDVHNIYGSMMSRVSRTAMVRRRPSVRPLVITRSTFAGAGKHVGKWLGDNLSTWEKYRTSIGQMLAFASIFQIPMTGSDVCGFGGNTTEQLCSRWAMLGAFSPFYRNHNGIDSESQEFYRWKLVAEAARKAIEIRYKLLDYIYTAFNRQARTGEPLLNPLFYLYPKDPNTFAIDLQFFYGDAILVSPVTEENSTSVDTYLPDDIFYDYYTGKPVRGEGKSVTLNDVDFTHIPLHIRGGNIVPLRANSANTTKTLREQPFNIIIAPGLDGDATGSLYLDDGESLEQKHTMDIKFSYNKGQFKMEGKFDPKAIGQLKIASISVLGHDGKAAEFKMEGGEGSQYEYNAETEVFSTRVDWPLTGPAQLKLS